MSTDTIEREPEQLVSRPGMLLLYMSRRSELRLTKRQRYPQRHPITGQMTGMSEGEFVGFREGVFRCPAEGRATLVDSLDGGEAEVDAAELVQWLEGHRLFGNFEEGFWRVDPTAPAISQAEMKNLIRLSQRADVEGLEEFVRQERAGWNRTDVIESALSAIEDSRAALAEIEREAKGK